MGIELKCIQEGHYRTKTWNNKKLIKGYCVKIIRTLESPKYHIILCKTSASGFINIAEQTYNSDTGKWDMELISDESHEYAVAQFRESTPARAIEYLIVKNIHESSS